MSMTLPTGRWGVDRRSGGAGRFAIRGLAAAWRERRLSAARCGRSTARAPSLPASAGPLRQTGNAAPCCAAWTEHTCHRADPLPHVDDRGKKRSARWWFFATSATTATWSRPCAVPGQPAPHPGGNRSTRSRDLGNPRSLHRRPQQRVPAWPRLAVELGLRAKGASRAPGRARPRHRQDPCAFGNPGQAEVLTPRDGHRARHSRVGHDILRGIPSLARGPDGARTPRALDGSGYPAGSGRDLLPGSRVLAVADVVGP